MHKDYGIDSKVLWGICPSLWPGFRVGVIFAMASDENIGENDGLIMEGPELNPQRNCRIYVSTSEHRMELKVQTVLR